MSVGDDMLAALTARYGTDSIGDGYAEWIAEFGPSWEALVSEVETQTGVGLVDGWALYWVDGPLGGAATFRILLETGDVLLAETGDALRKE
jgi:hypothetical protein